MQRRTPRWIFPAHDDEALEHAFPRFERAERQVLASLGFSEQQAAIDFLNGSGEHDIDPAQMLNMAQAVERLSAAIDSSQSIAIYADYDADGVTSAALLHEAFTAAGIRPRVYFPDRFNEGYGLNGTALERLAGEGIDLVLTVDCGIRAREEARLAARLGLDLIITDHHHAPDDLPAARAILNPNQAGDAYPNKGLSGVGVAYKLARALEQVFPAIHAQDLLDLVAIGTVADMSPLVGENRYLVRAGLERINAAPRIGVRALVQAAGYPEGRVDSRSIGFGLGPRINAAGRLEDARHAYELLTCREQGRAADLAEQLDALNRRRQDLTFEVVDAAVAQLADPDGMVLSAFGEQFHEGVVGLAASRLADEYFRPALVGKTGASTTRASARSVPGFHLARALEACGEFLLRFGGHEMAAGLTVENRNLEKFLERFDEVARERLDDDLLTPRLEIRAEVGLGEIGSRLLKFHDRLEPTGQENPRPLLATRAARIVHRRRVGGEGRHLKLKVSDGGRAIDAIAFRKGDRMDELPEIVDLAYRLERNEYQGKMSPQLVVEEIRPVEA